MNKQDLDLFIETMYMCAKVELGEALEIRIRESLKGIIKDQSCDNCTWDVYCDKDISIVKDEENDIDYPVDYCSEWQEVTE